MHVWGERGVIKSFILGKRIKTPKGISRDFVVVVSVFWASLLDRGSVWLAWHIADLESRASLLQAVNWEAKEYIIELTLPIEPFWPLVLNAWNHTHSFERGLRVSTSPSLSWHLHQRRAPSPKHRTRWNRSKWRTRQMGSHHSCTRSQNVKLYQKGHSSSFLQCLDHSNSTPSRIFESDASYFSSITRLPITWSIALCCLIQVSP